MIWVALIGPILNESSVSEFRKQLSLVVKSFIHSKPNPINVNMHNVDLYCLKNLVDSMEGQAILEGIGLSPLRDDKNWLGNKIPWEILNSIQNEHNSILSKLIEDPKKSITKEYFEPFNILYLWNFVVTKSYRYIGNKKFHGPNS